MNAGVIAAVAAGGATGAVLRYLTVLAGLRWFGAGFPYGTLAANVIGSFLIGVIAGWLANRAGGDHAVLRGLLITGLLGGFTTFSAYSLETMALLERREMTSAFVYAGGSVALALTATFLGLALARSITA